MLGGRRDVKAGDRRLRAWTSRLTPGLCLRVAVALAGIVGACLLFSGGISLDLAPRGRAALGVAALAVGLWGSELVPLPTTALLAVLLLYVSGAAARPEDALAGFSSPVLFFLLGSAGLGIAAEVTGLADRLAGWLLTRSRGSGPRLLGELLLSLPAQSLVVPSAMSRNAVLVPVYERVLDRLGRPASLGAAVMLALGVLGPLSSSALLSGGTSPVAAATALGGFTWVSWLVALAVPYYALLAVDAGLLWLFVRPAASDGSDPAPPAATPRPLSRAEKRVTAVVLLTSALWMLDSLTHWPPVVPAVLALVVLLMPGVGVLRWREFATRAPWSTAFVLAGAVSLAAALTQSGAAGWVADRLFAPFPRPADPAAAALIVFVVAAVITLAVPNRAAAITLVIPLATAYAAATPLSPVAAGLIVMIAVDAETIYPAQTAANLLAYDLGYFGPGLLARYNLATLFAAVAVIEVVALPWWRLVGLPGG